MRPKRRAAQSPSPATAKSASAAAPPKPAATQGSGKGAIPPPPPPAEAPAASQAATPSPAEAPDIEPDATPSESPSPPDDSRVTDLETRLAEVTAKLEEMGQSTDTPSGMPGMEDRMRSLLQLSEILSVRYNPFLDDTEADLYDNNELERFLPGQQAASGAGGSPGSAAAPSAPAPTAPAAEPRRQAARPEPRPPAARSGPSDAMALGQRLAASTQVVRPDMDPPEMRAAAPPDAPQADDAPDIDEEPMGDTPPEREVHEAEAEPIDFLRGPDAAERPPPRSRRGAPEPRPPRPAPGAHHVEPADAPARHSYYALCWFERLASEGDPSEIHLFVDHYASLGWIPPQHQTWMRRLARSVAPRRDDLTWDDLQLTGVDLARLHRENLRFLDRLFRSGFPEEGPEDWERQADGFLGGR